MTQRIEAVAVCMFLAGCAVRVNTTGNVTQTTVNTITTVVSTSEAPEALADIPSAPGERVSAELVARVLAPYGRWIRSTSLGSIWYPAAGTVSASFAPYATDGSWVRTDVGWYWQSTYSWGWLTFHYGRWVLTELGWAWVPGAQFAPAWVEWRVGSGWVAWAPLPPLGMRVNGPYVVCSAQHLVVPSSWSPLLDGSAVDYVTSRSVLIAPTTGLAGATYAWGPAVVPTADAQPAPAIVPIASAWAANTGSGGSAASLASNVHVSPPASGARNGWPDPIPLPPNFRASAPVAPAPPSPDVALAPTAPVGAPRPSGPISLGNDGPPEVVANAPTAAGESLQGIPPAGPDGYRPTVSLGSVDTAMEGDDPLPSADRVPAAYRTPPIQRLPNTPMPVVPPNVPGPSFGGYAGAPPVLPPRPYPVPYVPQPAPTPQPTWTPPPAAYPRAVAPAYVPPVSAPMPVAYPRPVAPAYAPPMVAPVYRPSVSYPVMVGIRR